MRGKRRDDVSQLIGMGITPAHAGKTRSHRKAPRSSRDHPRACGENLARHKKTGGATGSPPRMRGKQLLADFVVCALRITPACAGKTCTAKADCAMGADHPRVCGENGVPAQSPCFHLGSPPRVRGKRLSGFRLAVCNRITPACAGKTFQICILCYGASAHPRVCGENTYHRQSPQVRFGSPPRVRGKRFAGVGSHAYARITPACAGKTVQTLFAAY